MSVTDLHREREKLGLPDRDDVNSNGRSLADRAGDPVTTAGVDPQDGLFDQVVENAALEKALEKRLTAKEALKPKTKDYKESNAAAKGMIAGLEFPVPETGDEPLVIRCGRFRIKVAPTKGNKVSFETSPSTRTTISLIRDDA